MGTATSSLNVGMGPECPPLILEFSKIDILNPSHAPGSKWPFCSFLSDLFRGSGALHLGYPKGPQVWFRWFSLSIGRCFFFGSTTFNQWLIGASGAWVVRIFPLMKGIVTILLLRLTPIRIPNHRAPNHPFTIIWKHLKHVNFLSITSRAKQPKPWNHETSNHGPATTPIKITAKQGYSRGLVCPFTQASLKTLVSGSHIDGRG